MKTPSRLIVTAAVAGAAALLPLTAAAPAFADSHPATTATMTITPSASTVVTGDTASVSVKLEEDAGGDSGGLSGRLLVEKTQNGVTSTRADKISSAFSVNTYPIDTSGVGPIAIQVTFVAAPFWESDAQASTNIIVLGKASVSAASTTVNAGQAIVADVAEPAGSDAADGKIEATAPGLTLDACPIAPTNSTQGSCSITVPKNTPSGTYPVTLSYSGSPKYADTAVTTSITVVGTAASTTTTSGKGTTTTSTTSSSGSGTAVHATSGSSGSTVSNSSGSTGSDTTFAGGTQAAAGAESGAVAGAAGSVATTDGATPQDPTDASGQPTAVSEPLPGSLDSGVPAAVVSSVGSSFLPILVGAGVVGLVFLLLIALAIILIVRSVRRRAA